MVSDRILAESSGVSLRKRGELLLVVDHQITWLYTLTLVFATPLILALVAIITLVFVIFSGAVEPLEINLLVVMVPLAGGLLLLLRSMHEQVLKRRRCPAEQLKIVAVFDRRRGVAMDGQGQLIAPLNALWLGTAMEMSASAPSLMLRWPGGELRLAKGNAFIGGIGALQTALLVYMPAGR